MSEERNILSSRKGDFEIVLAGGLETVAPWLRELAIACDGYTGEQS